MRLPAAVQVPDARKYTRPAYLSPERMATYAYQIREALASAPSSVLEIGPGNGIASYVLCSNGVSVVTLDIDPRLHPDTLGSVTDLPFLDGAFDVVLCFEVLEHLPFDALEPCFRELSRVARSSVILSLPNYAHFYRVSLVIPILGKVQLGSRWPAWLSRKLKDHPEHYWELGRPGYSVRRVLDVIARAKLGLAKTYRIFESGQQMFVLQTRKSESPT